jgi:uncharacterized protein YcaQ
LKAAVERMGFIQADPIRAPARAQDLILRHRVNDYCAGHLEQSYPELELEEDILYAYGFLPRRIWQLLQPRQTSGLGVLENKVLEAVQQLGQTHPRELQTRLGKRRVINDWGGFSSATTRTLERLRHRGLLRIARRENGIRIYEPARPFDASLTPDERLRKLILVVASVLAPCSEKTLRAIVARYRRWGNPRKAVDELIRNGSLERQAVDEVAYLWHAGRSLHANVPRRVRFVAPFDPLVWDRARFEHFWGWPYRFEAYTPVASRVRGYYALPMLWADRVIGWANIGADAKGLHLELGLVTKPSGQLAFRSELEREVESFKTFLNLPPATSTTLTWI